MMQYTDKIDHKYWQENCVIAGVDEVGRGPLAGPVVTACVVLDPSDLPIGIKDSKKLSEKKRELLYDIIMDKCISAQVAYSYPQEIDSINIRNATLKAMRECVQNTTVDIDYLLIDGVDTLGIMPQEVAIIGGDDNSITIGAASIIAKVTRDRMMVQLDKIFPEYGFAAHKGYGTAVHIKALREYGATEIHRQSFIKRILGK